MEDAALPILNIAILGAFMLAGIRELGNVSQGVNDSSEAE